MRQWRLLTLTALLLTAPAVVTADAADDIEDLLTERWYEVEIIVFERLDVLDVNSAERLTQHRPRQWPHNLLDMRELQTDAVAPEIPFNPSQPSAYCLGYPMLPDAEPLHPNLLPRQEPPAPAAAEMARRAAEAAAEAAPEGAEAETQTAAIEPQLEPQLALETTELALTPYLQLLADVARFEASLYDSSYAWLPDLTMQDYVKAINRQSHLRPLLHRRWRAPIPPRATPQPIYIVSEVNASAPATRAGFAKIEGHLSVTVGRYLHFAPTLWYHADNLGLAPIALPAVQTLPGPRDGHYMEMRQSRRMRSGDLHYLDHPKFGIVVRIDPVTIPEPLLTAWEALDQTAE